LDGRLVKPLNNIFGLLAFIFGAIFFPVQWYMNGIESAKLNSLRNDFLIEQRNVIDNQKELARISKVMSTQSQISMESAELAMRFGAAFCELRFDTHRDDSENALVLMATADLNSGGMVSWGVVRLIMHKLMTRSSGLRNAMENGAINRETLENVTAYVLFTEPAILFPEFPRGQPNREEQSAQDGGPSDVTN
jgi:hypothetical protein